MGESITVDLWAILELEANLKGVKLGARRWVASLALLQLSLALVHASVSRRQSKFHLSTSNSNNLTQPNTFPGLAPRSPHIPAQLHVIKSCTTTDAAKSIPTFLY